MHVGMHAMRVRNERALLLSGAGPLLVVVAQPGRPVYVVGACHSRVWFCTVCRGFRCWTVLHTVCSSHRNGECGPFETSAEARATAQCGKPPLMGPCQGRRGRDRRNERGLVRSKSKKQVQKPEKDARGLRCANPVSAHSPPRRTPFEPTVPGAVSEDRGQTQRRIDADTKVCQGAITGQTIAKK